MRVSVLVGTVASSLWADCCGVDVRRAVHVHSGGGCWGGSCWKRCTVMVVRWSGQRRGVRHRYRWWAKALATRSQVIEQL